MNSKKVHIIAPKKSDAKKMSKNEDSLIKENTTKGKIRRKTNEFGDNDAI